MSKKLLSLALALVMSLSLAVPAMAADEKTETPVTPYAVSADVKGKIVILHTNDTHGADVAEEGKVIGDRSAACPATRSASCSPPATLLRARLSSTCLRVRPPSSL